MKAPKAQKIETILKDQRIDPYYWMNQKKAVLPYIKKEQKYFEHQMEPAKKLQNQLYEELKKKNPRKGLHSPLSF